MAAPYLSRILIHTEALRANYAILLRHAAPAQVGAAVKADAYGLGMGPVATILAEEGCKTFFVANIDEALELRALLPDAPTIAVLGGVPANALNETRENRLTPVLNDLDAVQAWSSHAFQRGKLLPALIHLDTGMHRLGLTEAETARLAADTLLLGSLRIRAWMSHLACADAFDHPMTISQRDRFVRLLRTLPKAPASLANSSGIFWGIGYLFDLVRPGAALYGINPTPHRANPLHGVVELQAPLLEIQDVPSGASVGYGATHRFTHPARVATVALGYADGYLRALGNKGTAKIGLFEAPVIGRISMDLTTLDVTGLPPSVAHVGAYATLMGPHRPVDALAADAGTIGYEILTRLGPRVIRKMVP